MWRGAPVDVAGLAVRAVAGDRKAEMGERRADLVQEAGARAHLEQRRRVEHLERAVRELADARPARALVQSRDAHARGPVARGHERQLGAARVLDAPEHERAVDLLDPVFGERTAQPLPGRLERRDQQRARSVDVEPVHHAAAQTALADPVHFGVSRDHRVQDGSGLVLAQGMDGRPGGLVDGEPARPLRSQHERCPRIGERALLVAARERSNPQLDSARESLALLGFPERASVPRHGAAREQAAHLGARQLELLGQEQVETPSRVLRAYEQSARAGSHADRVAAH